MARKQENTMTLVVGNFTVTTRPKIGKGQFGDVYKAVHNTTGETAAVKEMVFKTDGERNEYMQSMARREVEMMQRLKRHRNIVHLIEHVIHDGSFWLFMEYCDLKDLKSYLQKRPDINLLSKLNIMRQVASAMAFMHSQDPAIIHRDMKLENILMKSQGAEVIAKVTDFGFSKFYEERLAASYAAAFRQGQMMTACGTGYYMAPEFFAELDTGLQFTAAVDVFALGLVFSVIFECAPGNADCIPLSVESKRRNQTVNFGYEMIHCHREGKKLPTVLEYDRNDDDTVRRLKRIILNMTKFRSVHRKNVTEVEEELTEMSEQSSRDSELRSRMATMEQQFRSLETENNQLLVDQSIKATRISDLEMENKNFRDNQSIKETRISDLEKENKNLRDNQSIKETRISDLKMEIKNLRDNQSIKETRKSDLEMENKNLRDNQSIKKTRISDLEKEREKLREQQTSTRAERSPRNVPETFKAQSPGAETQSLRRLLSGTLTKQKEVHLPGDGMAVALVRGELCCSRLLGGITIHSMELEQRAHIERGDMGGIFSVADVGDAVVVAATEGLFLLSYSGKRVKTISRRYFTGVCHNSTELYAACWKDSSIHKYDMRDWQETGVIETPCSGEHRHTLTIHSGQLVTACYDEDCIYTYNDSHKLVDTDRKRGESVGEFRADGKRGESVGEFHRPHVCACDADHMLLVADSGNNRLQLRDEKLQWHVLALQPPPRWPTGAVYTGDALYVCTFRDELIKYVHK